MTFLKKYDKIFPKFIEELKKMIENKQYKTSESGRKAQKNTMLFESKNSFIIELINDKINYKK